MPRQMYLWEARLSDILRLYAENAADSTGAWRQIVLTIADGQISQREVNVPNAPAEVRLGAGVLLPGFMDIHVHGGAGRSVMEGTTEALFAVGRHLARHGVTGFLATTVTASIPDTVQILQAVRDAMRSPENGRDGAKILGCHLEGPYINPLRKGAQPEQFILPPDVQDFRKWATPYLDVIQIMTLAPELPGALELIRFLAAHNIITSIGHTDATYAEVDAAIAAGARHVTHCYNAMRPLGSREPGVVGAAFSRKELTAELIWDNVHVHPASCQALLAAKHEDGGVILISDGIPGAGMPEGYGFTLGDLPIVVRDGTARLPDGTLAGSLLTMDAAYRNAKATLKGSVFGSQEQCIALTSVRAARALRLKKGQFEPEYAADFVLLDENDRVWQTWVAGRLVYSAETV